MRAFLPFFKVSGTGSSNPCPSPKGDKTWVFLCLNLHGLRKNGEVKLHPQAERHHRPGEKRFSLRPLGPAPAPDTGRTFPGRRSCGGNLGIRSHLLPPAQKPNPRGRPRFQTRLPSGECERNRVGRTPLSPRACLYQLENNNKGTPREEN